MIQLPAARACLRLLTPLFLVTGGGFWLAEAFTSFDAKFRKARPLMEQYVRDALSAPPDAPLPPLPERFGAFIPREAKRLTAGVMLRCVERGRGQTVFLTYSTRPLAEWPPDMAAKRPDEPVERYQHLEGHWYRMYRA